MEDKSLSSGEPSILLWIAASLILALGARVFVEYLHRVRHLGPARGWREVLFGGLGWASGLWSGAIVGISSQGLSYEIGFHPVKIGIALVGSAVLASGVIALLTRWRGWLTQLAGAALMAGAANLVPMGVVWALGPAPGPSWRIDLAAFSVLLLAAGHLVGLRMVMSSSSRQSGDSRLRRLLTALMMAVTMIASQELVLLSADLSHQVVSSHARMLPEVAVALLAGVAVPIMLIVMLIDQRMQRHARRAHRRKLKSGFYNTRHSEFAESRLDPAHDSRHGA